MASEGNKLKTLDEVTDNFQNQANGVYFIRIESEVKQWVKKIMMSKVTTQVT
ncbi:hypothetical protein ADIWIN_3645 [Winogradskyella psychrotolerans RS-3]|uniref:Uncharacterized protein n=1 Tax=Winogradskyella psychrotolerans RS-3 TaxID=641526 RepID=S7WU71_9FLAO|nr:hypothetical protein [Winogradskyella psychrotolerans]EPR70289.1 hypothetical protein ADIWIN_3645 [Winogradskyella psychrotolerans RS-3]